MKSRGPVGAALWGLALPLVRKPPDRGTPPIPIARRAGSQRLQRVDGREWIVEKSDAVDFD